MSGPQVTSLTMDEAIKVAIGLHESGQREQAEAYYREILRIDPHNLDVVYLFGLLLRSDPRNAKFLRIPPWRKPANARRISVVMATYNRGHLLRRSLEGYAGQTEKDFELVIVDDGSTDDTFSIVQEAASGLDIKYIRLEKPVGLWRDAASIINIGIRASLAELVVCTHPEVIPGRRSLELMHTALRDKVYICCKCYVLTRKQQTLLDEVDWRHSLTAIRSLPGFYEETPPLGLMQFSHASMEAHQKFDTWVLGGMSRPTWQWFGGFTEQSTWGTPDITFGKRRLMLGIENITQQDDETYCIHQNHDDPDADVASPRDIDACFDQVPAYWSLEQALEHNL